jgi:hypothetical protein
MIKRAIVAIVLASSAALAQEEGPNAENVAVAKVLFDDGQKLMDEKKYPEACAKFAASSKKLPKVGTLLNLADCYEKNNQTASAWATYNDAIALGRKQNRPEFEEFAKKKTNELGPKLVRLTIAVPPDVRVPGMKIERDGGVLEEGEWSTDVPVDPGKHTIVVTAPKKIKWKTETDVVDKSLTINVPKLDDAPQAWPNAQQPEVIEKVVVKPSPFTPLRIAGITTGAVGLGSVLGGLVLGIASKSTYDSALSHCANKMASTCPPDAVSDGKTAHTMADVATVLFVIGSVATATGVTLFLLGGPKEQTQARLGPGSIVLEHAF